MKFSSADLHLSMMTSDYGRLSDSGNCGSMRSSTGFIPSIMAFIVSLLASSRSAKSWNYA